MRHYIIIFTLLIVFISGSIFSELYIEKTLNNMAEKINEIDSLEKLDETTEEWEKKSDYLEIVIDHSELEEVSELLWSMEEEIKYDYDEFMESKRQATEMLAHIKQRNRLGIISIL